MAFLLCYTELIRLMQGENKMKKIKPGKPLSINRRLLTVILLCWIIPVVIIVSFMSVSYRKGILAKTEGLLEDELGAQMEFLAVRIDNAVAQTKEVSYEKVLEKAWKDYQASKTTESMLYHIINSNMRSKFYLDKKFDAAVFYMPGTDRPVSYNSRAGISYNDYIEKVNDTVSEYIEQDSSDAHLEIIDGRVFIIRNLYTTTNYEKFGTLAAEVNKEYLFQDVEGNLGNRILFNLNGNASWIQLSEDTEKSLKKEQMDMIHNYYGQLSDRVMKSFDSHTYKGFTEKRKYRDYTIGMVFLVEDRILYAELYNLYKVIAFVIAVAVPVLLYMIYFMKKHITDPVQVMVSASEEMEAGNLGTKIEAKMPNAEFSYLRTSFNQMSRQVKCLFDYAYDEKIARKDAKIMALQAQINPHFLNNTLEMMNWQARMSGDITVCKMIEALGTVLDYRMSRDHKNLINLAEELHCADAYFYIISMRFGKRLNLEKEIDDDLMQVQVPQLILQPIIENAVVHGIEQVRSGIIKIHIYHDDKNIYLEVINSGKPMTQEDVERIQQILFADPSQIKKGKGQHTSLGIRNVNERIRLIYGEEYGLSITPYEEDKTKSVITLPYQEEAEKCRESEKRKVQNELKNIGIEEDN